MHQIQVQVLELQVIQRFIQTKRDVLGGMMSAPQLHKSKQRYFISWSTESRQLGTIIIQEWLKKTPKYQLMFMPHWHARGVLKVFQLFYWLWRIHVQHLQKIYVTQTHLTHDKHVLPSNDALLHFGLHCPPQLHLIVITVGRVQVTVTSSYSCLSCTLTQFWACVLMTMW